MHRTDPESLCSLGFPSPLGSARRGICPGVQTLIAFKEDQQQAGSDTGQYESPPETVSYS